MELLKAKKAMFKRALCLLLCVTIVTTGIPIYSNTANAAETQTKFVKVDQEVFVPSSGEKAKITFNLESKRSVNIYVKDGKKVIENDRRLLVRENNISGHL